MDMIVNKEYCMSSFLTFRYIANPAYTWRSDITPHFYEVAPKEKRAACGMAEDIEACIKKTLEKVDFSKTALLLSGGIDSGILASYMPRGATAYTVSNPSKKSALEVERAAKICDKMGLKHKIIEITWNDYLNSMDLLMKNDGCPVFANEPQVYTLVKQITKDGFNVILYGDMADLVFGGMDLMLSKDWTFDEWVERYTFVKPQDVLVTSASVLDVYEKYRTGETSVDFVRFIEEIFAASSSSAYINAFDLVGVKYIDPYAEMSMKEPLDLKRVRSGDSKYLLRDLYKKRFPDFEVPEKIAMVRAMDIWLKDWEGPKRKEFKPDCVKNLTGEQKFLIYSLERFLNLFEL